MATKTRKKSETQATAAGPEGGGRFVWNGRTFPVPAAVAARCLQEIEDEHGEVTPALVLQAAEDPRHPLHPCFEWDDELAAKQHRLAQAGEIVRSVRVRYVTETGERRSQPVRLSVVREETHQRAYLSVSKVQSERCYREQVMAEARAALQGWIVRYSTIAELAGVVEAVKLELARMTS